MIEHGTLVEVRSRFDGSWAGGFEVTRTARRGASLVYELRRLSDGAILPAGFGEQDVRRAR